MGGNNDLTLTKVSDQLSTSSFDEDQLPAVSSPQPFDPPAPDNVSFLDNPVPQNENVCRLGDAPDNPADAIKSLRDSLPKAPEPPPPNADQKEIMEWQKQISDYKNMMQTLSNALRMLEDTNKRITGNLR